MVFVKMEFAFVKPDTMELNVKQEFAPMIVLEMEFVHL